MASQLIVAHDILNNLDFPKQYAHPLEFLDAPRVRRRPRAGEQLKPYLPASESENLEEWIKCLAEARTLALQIDLTTLPADQLAALGQIMNQFDALTQTLRRSALRGNNAMAILLFHQMVTCERASIYHALLQRPPQKDVAVRRAVIEEALKDQVSPPMFYIFRDKKVTICAVMQNQRMAWSVIRATHIGRAKEVDRLCSAWLRLKRGNSTRCVVVPQDASLRKIRAIIMRPPWAEFP